jgi:uncharacterized metal-binding protein YceD (DUF177 family)
MTDPAYSFTVLAKDIPAAGRTFTLTPEEEQRAALARQFGIPEVTAMTADLTVRPVRGEAYTVRGSVQATVVQTCVVTLEPFAQDVRDEIDLTLMRAEDVDPARLGDHDLVDPDEAEGPEVFHNGRIDLGVIASEHLALALDPYPRAPGVEFSGYTEEDEKPSPFAALSALKDPS